MERAEVRLRRLRCEGAVRARELYAYDRTPLNAVVEASDETEIGRRDTIAFDAAYGGERLRAYLFLPSHAAAPYQTVVFFPGAGAFQLRSSRDMSLVSPGLILRSGRALVYPIYRGTYEWETPADVRNALRRSGGTRVQSGQALPSSAGKHQRRIRAPRQTLLTLSRINDLPCGSSRVRIGRFRKSLQCLGSWLTILDDFRTWLINAA